MQWNPQNTNMLSGPGSAASMPMNNQTDERVPPLPNHNDYLEGSHEMTESMEKSLPVSLWSCITGSVLRDSLY